MIEAAENILRGVAVGGFVTLGAALAGTPGRAPARWIGALFFLCAIGHVVDNDTALRGLSGHASVVSWMLSALGPPMFWAFAIALFSDLKNIRPVLFVPSMLALALSFGAGLLPQPAARWFSLCYVALSVILVAHAFGIIARGWQGDLVERRRRLRAPVMAAAALYVLVIAAGDFAQTLGFAAGLTPLAQAAMLALLAIGGAFTILRADADLLGAPPPQPGIVDDGAKVLLARLLRALDEEQIWRKEGLTIGMLAAHVAAPEHKLRRLINGTLGYRNFAALMNERRIAAAKTALTSPDRKPVSAIAFDLGFGSLGPFNRAFKEATGTTPTAWRQNPP
ncbi:MAG TPA: helix-turn-helix domain-containing protein [Rhizomicrobium sp.]|jgi:AraC-like DNA-binding protein